MSYSSRSSIDSASNTSSSTTSRASAIIILADDFKQRYGEIDNKNLPIPQLVSQAERLIRALGASTLNNVIEYENVTEVQADKVLEAMLAQAESCGGESGKRPETLHTLHDLALTWVTHLLFVFRCGSHSQQPNDTPSDIATPTIDDTSTFMDTTSGARHRRDGLRDEILKRDGYQCVVTEWLEFEHPLYKHLDHPDPRFHLEACHILRRATAVFSAGRDSSSYISATSTFDILRNYASLSEQVISNLKDVIDAPSNAFLLAPHLHSSWDIFQWCLKPTETPNKYIVKSFGAYSSLFPDQVNRIVVFRDRSAEFEQSSSRKRKAPEIDLPDSKFIAIHAAIAEVLHMSGAGRFLDELFRKFGPSGESSPVGCWEDFEMMVRDAKLRESCEQVVHVP